MNLKPFLMLVLVLPLNACLASSYRIPSDEVARLAALPPEQRGESVRVVQRLDFDKDPSHSGYVERSSSSSGGGVVFIHNPTVVHHRHVHVTDTARHVHSSSASVTPSVQAPAPSSSGVVHAPSPTAPAGTTTPSPTPVGTSAPIEAAAPVDGRPPAPSLAEPLPETGTGPADAGPVESAPASGSGESFDFDSAEFMIAAVITMAVAGTVILVATEGPRYDGWLGLDPDAPVHVIHASGARERTTLAELTAEDAWAAEVVLVEDEIDATRLGRAPLDRVGFVWRMEGGAMQYPTPDHEDPLAATATIGLGYYPLQQLGILLSTWLGYGSHNESSVLGVKYGLEIDIMPLSFGILQLGGYGVAGMGFGAAEANFDYEERTFHAPFLGFGALVELEISTRLAAIARAGVDWQSIDGDWNEPTALFSLGLSVY